MLTSALPALSPRPARHFPGPRILHAILSSGLAGSERYCADLANRQAELGHEVHVVGRRGSPLLHILDPRVRFHGISRLLARWQLPRLVRRLDPDVCHGHLSAACKIIGALPRTSARVATLHVGYKSHQHQRLDGVICVNQAQAERLAGYAGNVRIIPNWVPAMAPAAGTDSLRAELGLAEDTFVVGAVGRLHASKGADLLIRAFRASAPRNAALVLIGEGPQRAELEKLRGDDHRIHLVGHRTDVRACLESFDLFVSPSREESFGLAIIEAMSVGLPVIATATEGPAEHLRNQPVTLVAVDDAKALTQALAGAAARFAGGNLGRQHYELGDFSPALRVDEIMDFYRESIGSCQTVSSPRLVTVAAT